MPIIALFFPAVISVCIERRRSGSAAYAFPDVLIQYILYTVADVLFTESVIVYGLKMTDSAYETLNGFSFFTEYTAIAVLFAVLAPFAKEVICRHFEIRLEKGRGADGRQSAGKAEGGAEKFSSEGGEKAGGLS